MQQALSSEQEVAAIASEDATDSADAAKVTTVPDLVSLLGHTQQEAIDILQHGATAAEPRAVNEEGNPITVSYTHLDVYKRQLHRSMPASGSS